MPTAPNPTRRPAIAVLKGLLGSALAAAALVSMPSHALIAIGNNPLYLVIGKANVLVTLDNSNSMDEAANGSAVGSNAASSKSEIARGVVRNLTTTYRGRINMGLMAYRQNAISGSHLHNSPYDASYNPATFDPAWTGSRSSATKKKFRLPNSSSPGNFIHYNVALPFYASSNQGDGFCYSRTANAASNFNNGESPLTGPWDTYRCFNDKTGTSDALPTDSGSESAAGYNDFMFSGAFSPTDSDFAQGILDFGRFLTWNYVGRTWFRNDSPGRGYLYVPLAELGTTQAAAINNKLACNIPGNPAPCTSAGIPNAGLTPIEGTLLTARDYFKGTLSSDAEGYTAGCYPLPTSCGKNFVVLLTDGLPSTDKSGATLADPARALADAAAAAAALKVEGVETYVIGFALPYGTNPNSLDVVAAAGGTTTAFSANDPATLEAAFNAIFEDIFRKSSSFSSVAQNSTSINTGSMVYQGRFDSTDWSGEVIALRPELTGPLTQMWNTSDPGHFAAPASRKIFTLLPGTGGREFKLLTDLSAAQQTALAAVACSSTLTGATCAQARIDWLRGTRTQEAPAGALRRRTKLLGDVISSSPYYVKSSDTLFVGANDGMLHAFNATTGDERFAFVPNAVIANVHKVTLPSYSHEYFVDGEIAVSSTAMTPGKNILVGTLGRGGRSVYALDVTSPSTFAATNVMWEFSDPDLGLALGKPVIVKLNNGQTAVILGNGYNSVNERSFLFIINITTGALIRKIDTGSGSAAASNGLAAPSGWDLDSNGTVDLMYAGDLLGNLWKFDLSSATPSIWASAYGSAATPAPMFVALDSLGNRQAITGLPEIGLNSRKGDPHFGKRYVFFGSGRYLTTSDVTTTLAQSWYGLIDEASVISGRSVLRQRTIDLEATLTGRSVRSFSVAVAGDMAGKQGWFVDLVSPTSGNLGERMVGEHKLFGSVLLASSMIPTTNPCIPGGEGFLNAIDPFSGGSLASLFFDANNDGAFTDADRIGTGAARRAVGSINPGINLISDGIMIGSGERGSVIVGGTGGGDTGNVRQVGAKDTLRSGRISWREVVNK